MTSETTETSFNSYRDALSQRLSELGDKYQTELDAICDDTETQIAQIQKEEKARSEKLKQMIDLERRDIENQLVGFDLAINAKTAEIEEMNEKLVESDVKMLELEEDRESDKQRVFNELNEMWGTSNNLEPNHIYHKIRAILDPPDKPEIIDDAA